MQLTIPTKLKAFAKEVWKDTSSTVLLLFRILIPVSIIVKILKETGAVDLIGDALAPLMQVVGLPGEMGLVWATGMITNLFGGILAFMQLSQGLHMTIAQVTIISAMMLVAHTFPIELQIARKTGVRIWIAFTLRFVGAMLLGMLLNGYYRLTGLMDTEALILWKPEMAANPTLWEWTLGELKSYAVIICFVVSLIILVKLLRELGIIRLITKGFGPILRLMGIGKEVTTISIIGLTLGIVYGGAIMINETKSKKIFRRDIFYSMALMGLCHSLIEDTILVLSIGADITGMLILRLIFAFTFTWLLVRISRRIPDQRFYKYIMLPEKTGKETVKHAN